MIHCVQATHGRMLHSTRILSVVWVFPRESSVFVSLDFLASSLELKSTLCKLFPGKWTVPGKSVDLGLDKVFLVAWIKLCASTSLEQTSQMFVLAGSHSVLRLIWPNWGRCGHSQSQIVYWWIQHSTMRQREANDLLFRINLALQTYYLAWQSIFLCQSVHTCANVALMDRAMFALIFICKIDHLRMLVGKIRSRQHVYYLGAHSCS